MRASERGHLETVRYLVENGAKIDEGNKFGNFTVIFFQYLRINIYSHILILNTILTLILTN